MPTLVIANKCYSSWSLRPWLLMKQLGIAFDDVQQLARDAIVDLGCLVSFNRVADHDFQAVGGEA